MTARKPRQRSLLGGYQPEPKDTRGRKPIAWSAQLSKKVRHLRALGASIDVICREVGLSDKTLNRIYPAELAGAVADTKLELGMKLLDLADEGHTPSIRLAMKLLEKGDAAIPLKRPTAQPKPPRELKLGKKDQAVVDAHVAHEGTGWAELLQPEPKPN